MSFTTQILDKSTSPRHPHLFRQSQTKKLVLTNSRKINISTSSHLHALHQCQLINLWWNHKFTAIVSDQLEFAQTPNTCLESKKRRIKNKFIKQTQESLNNCRDSSVLNCLLSIPRSLGMLCATAAAHSKVKTKGYHYVLVDLV